MGHSSAHHAGEPKAAQEWIQRVSSRFEGLSVLREMRCMRIRT